MKNSSLFKSGHTACAGCGQAIAARLVVEAAGANTIIANNTGCLEVFSAKYPETAWGVPWIHSLFENSAAVASGIEAALIYLGKKDAINVIAQGGDGSTADIGLQALSGMLERGHDILYICFDNEAYMNCLSLDSLVMTKDGLKKITEIKTGDGIYAFDQNTYQLVIKECSGVFDNGLKEVFELKTPHHSIKATANHPFLILKRNGRGKQNTFVWKTLEDVKIGDRVVILKGQYRYQDFLIDNKFFRTEEVTSVEHRGVEPTLDLRVEGEHNFIADGIVVHNTGVQRSGLTPFDTNTTTSPSSARSSGNIRPKKPMPEICLAHGILYVATASAGFPQDLSRKVKKAISIKGPKYIQVHASCPLGWRHETNQMLLVAKLAVETGLYPLFEYENGALAGRKQIVPKPVEEYLKAQGRFKHLLNNPEEIKKIQEIADNNIKKYNLKLEV